MRLRFLRVFVVAVLLNYLWELGQSPLYAGMGDLPAMWWHCFIASLGDGLLVLLIFATCRAMLRRQNWFEQPGIGGYALMLIVGLVIGITGEPVAVHAFHWWAYTPRMPVVPKLNIGITPVVQMTLLPPVVFRVVTAWQEHQRH